MRSPLSRHPSADQSHGGAGFSLHSGLRRSSARPASGSAPQERSLRAGSPSRFQISKSHDQKSQLSSKKFAFCRRAAGSCNGSARCAGRLGTARWLCKNLEPRRGCRARALSGGICASRTGRFELHARPRTGGWIVALFARNRSCSRPTLVSRQPCATAGGAGMTVRRWIRCGASQESVLTNASRAASSLLDARARRRACRGPWGWLTSARLARAEASLAAIGRPQQQRAGVVRAALLWPGFQARRSRCRPPPSIPRMTETPCCRGAARLLHCALCCESTCAGAPLALHWPAALPSPVPSASKRPTTRGRRQPRAAAQPSCAGDRCRRCPLQCHSGRERKVYTRRRGRTAQNIVVPLPAHCAAGPRPGFVTLATPVILLSTPPGPRPPAIGWPTLRLRLLGCTDPRKPAALPFRGARAARSRHLLHVRPQVHHLSRRTLFPA